LKKRFACRHCHKEYAHNVLHMRSHLVDCQKYIESAKTMGIQNAITRSAIEKTAKQPLLAVMKITPAQKDELDLKFAMACFLQGLSFNVYEGIGLKDALHALHPAYKPPSRKTIAGPLLDKAYAQVKGHMDKLIADNPALNIVCDESSDINSSRISNISIHTQYGSIFWASDDVGATRMNAENVTAWLKSHLMKISDNNLSRINSLATDTCKTMLSVAKNLESDPQLSHVLYAPCDSHGTYYYDFS